MDRIPASVGAAGRGFLTGLTARAAGDERVVALFLGGSHARGTADERSDLDLYLLTTERGYEPFVAGRHGLMRSLGDAVFLEEHSNFGFLMLLYMYADGVRGELALPRASRLAEVHAGPYAVLLDKSGGLDGAPLPEWRLDSATRSDVVRRLLVWFWYDRRLLDVALARDQLWSAHFYLERCRERCVDLARMWARPDVWPGGNEKADAVLDPRTTALIAATVARAAGVDHPRRLVEHVTATLRA